MPDPTTADPTKQGQYDVPDKLYKTIQITNPEKQTPANTLHYWDYRRGIITSTAYKRMCENAETDSDISIPPAAKRKETGAMDKCPAAHQPRSTRSPKLSPLALRRKYLPRGGSNSLHSAAHQTAAAAAAQNQKQPPQAHQPPKNKQRLLQLQSGLLD